MPTRHHRSHFSELSTHIMELPAYDQLVVPTFENGRKLARKEIVGDGVAGE